RGHAVGADPAELSPAPPALGVGRAAVLGAIQGPTELLPVSSSAHLSLVPWLTGWPWHELDTEARKRFEVALHAAGPAALRLGQPRLIAGGPRALHRRRTAGGALPVVPPA